MNEITKKQRWVLVPCLDYDVPAMESWLEEQAMQGLFLSKDDGFFLGLACFETGNPKRVRYRLGAVPKEKAFSEFDEKKQAAIALAEEMGWEFVAEWKEFLIYRCDDAHACALRKFLFRFLFFFLRRLLPCICGVVGVCLTACTEGRLP